MKNLSKIYEAEQRVIEESKLWRAELIMVFGKKNNACGDRPRNLIKAIDHLLKVEREGKK